MNYKLVQRNGIDTNIETDTMSIPLDEGNVDYQDYLAWVAEGNVAEIKNIILEE